jgi:hypothetical protein
VSSLESVLRALFGLPYPSLKRPGRQVCEQWLHPYIPGAAPPSRQTKRRPPLSVEGETATAAAAQTETVRGLHSHTSTKPIERHPLSSGEAARLVNHARCHRSDLRVGTSITESTANFRVNRRMNNSQQMRWPDRAPICCSRFVALSIATRSVPGLGIDLTGSPNADAAFAKAAWCPNVSMVPKP